MYYLTSYELQVKVLRPTQHNIGHFGDVSQDSLLAWYGTTKTNQSIELYYNTK